MAGNDGGAIHAVSSVKAHRPEEIQPDVQQPVVKPSLDASLAKNSIWAHATTCRG